MKFAFRACRVLDTFFEDFGPPYGGLGQKSGGLGQGLDSVWLSRGLAWTAIGQGPASAFFPLGRACTAISHGFVSLSAAPSTGFDKDCTLLLEHSGRVGEGKHNTDMHVAVAECVALLILRV